MNKKIAIFSDIHGNLQALEAILMDIEKRNIKDIFFLGDAIGIGPNPRECLNLIMKKNINMVLGNHELYYLKGTNIDPSIANEENQHHIWIWNQLNDNHKTFLNNCKLKENITFNKYKIGLEHFLLNTKKEYPFENLDIINDQKIINKKMELMDENIIFIGHQHKPFTISQNNKKIIDIGSSGCTKNDKTYYVVLSCNNNDIEVEKIKLNYNREKFEKNFNSTAYPDKEIIGKIFFGISKE